MCVIKRSPVWVLVRFVGYGGGLSCKRLLNRPCVRPALVANMLFMPRNLREFAPGKGCHITARTQGGAKWFTETIRDQISQFILEATASFGHRLLAFVVMPNHFHIVMRQSHSPVGWAMQRIMQRTSIAVRKYHQTDGHVFGRPYWSCVCTGPDYLRQAIVYVHLNPLAAGLCTDASSYKWNTHMAYVSGREWWIPAANLQDGLLLFGNKSIHRQELINNYKRFVDYCVMRRRVSIPGANYLFDVGDLPAFPRTEYGDKHWSTIYSHKPKEEYHRPWLPDIRDKAVQILRGLDPGLTLDVLRAAGASKRSARTRVEVVAALSASGYRTSSIGRVLRISSSRVSQIKAQIRDSAAAKT